MDFQRFAIFFTPEPRGSLADAGARWLGWDSATGQTVTQPDVAGLDMAEVAQAPRRYGFHATIKPPFHLAPDTTAADLRAAFGTLCADLAACPEVPLELARLGRFLALVPGDATPEADAMSMQVVRALDRFRAPITSEEAARRRGRGLSAEREANLRRWGYPHVGDQFRFHMTLTGRLDAPTCARAEAAAAAHFQAAMAAPMRLDALTLMGQDGNAMFHQIARIALTG